MANGETSITGDEGKRPQLRSNREIAIHVPDLARAEAFYGKLLGFRLVRRTLDQLEFDTGELRLYVNRNVGKPVSYIPSFDVEDYHDARRFLEEAGCKVRFAGEQPVPYFEDPFGFVFDIIERPATEAGGGKREAGSGDPS